jgi:hypothetical protein
MPSVCIIELKPPVFKQKLGGAQKDYRTSNKYSGQKDNRPFSDRLQHQSEKRA